VAVLVLPKISLALLHAAAQVVVQPPELRILAVVGVEAEPFRLGALAVLVL
jgi:hypothetical protein